MKTKNLVLIAVLLGLGTTLSFVLPYFFVGMKLDILLTMMFLSILLFPEKKHVLLIGLLTGLLSGLISTFPGGFIPNIIDKFITAFVALGLVLLLSKITKPLINAGILTCIGTVISGVIFLSSALIIAGLPGDSTFLGLFLAVVVPATVLNTILMVILYPILQSVVKRSSFEPIQKSA